jgi:hypothetical protein
VDAVGFAAALAVLSSFCMSSIVPLRMLAVLSNVLFGLYGVLAHLYPVFFLHSILLPINLFKLARCQSSRRSIQVVTLRIAGRRRSSGGLIEGVRRSFAPPLSRFPAAHSSAAHQPGQARASVAGRARDSRR